MIHEHAIHLLEQHRNHYREQASKLSSANDTAAVQMHDRWIAEIELAIEDLSEAAANHELNGDT